MEEVSAATVALVLAVDLGGVIKRNLVLIDFSERTIHLFLTHNEFPSIQFRNHQICFLEKWTDETLSRRISVNELTIVFRITTRTVWREFLRDSSRPIPIECHAVLDPDIKSSLIVRL
jgi:hypothetical protein